MKTYEDGLNEAWEAARKVLCDSGCNLVKLENIFDSHTLDGIFSVYTAKEAIEKIKEYEEAQKKSVFKVGDRVKIMEEHDIVGLPAAKVGTIGEVMEIDYVSGYLIKIYGENSMFYYYSGNALKSANDVIIVGDEVVDKNGWGAKGVVTKIDERCISIVDNEGWVSRYVKDEFKKTGRHFPQIEEMLKQMQEEEE